MAKESFSEAIIELTSIERIISFTYFNDVILSCNIYSPVSSVALSTFSPVPLFQLLNMLNFLMY